MRTTKQTFPEIALVSGLVANTCLQIDGHHDAFFRLFQFLTGFKQNDGASVLFECSLCTDPHQVFSKRHLQSKKNVEIYPKLNIRAGAKNGPAWNIALKQSEALITMSDEMLADFAEGIHRKAIHSGDFDLGPYVPSDLMTNEAKRRWQSQNAIFVF